MTPRAPRRLAAPSWLAAGWLLCAACSSSLTEEELATRDELYQRAVQYYDVGRYVQAEQQARLGRALDPEDGMLNLLVGRAILMQGALPKLAEARPFLEAARSELPDDQQHKANLALGQYHLLYGRELAGHVARERRALVQNPNPDPVQRAKLQQDLDERESRAREHYQQAAEFVASAHAATPDSLQVLEVQGQIAALLGQDTLAFAALGRALEVLAESRAFMNRTLAFSTSLPVGEEERLRERLVADIRREIAIRDVLAGLYKRQGLLADEEREYTRMLQLDETLAAVYYSRGMVRFELGRIPEAAEDMRDFLMRTNLDPGAEQVARAVEILHQFERLQPDGAGGAA